jgi:DnaK suppressor protein
MASKTRVRRIAKTSVKTSGKPTVAEPRAVQAAKKTAASKPSREGTTAVKRAGRKVGPAKQTAVKATATARPAAKAGAGSRATGQTGTTTTPVRKTAGGKKVTTKTRAVAKRPAGKKNAASKAVRAADRRKVIAAAARTSHDRAVSATTEHDAEALANISVLRHSAGAPSDGSGSKPSRKDKYTKRDLVKFRAMLLRVREELERQVASLRSSSLTREDNVNSEEDGTDAFERQLALNLASTEGDSIFAIDQALKRIEDGTYGACETCGCLIGRERLQALPFVQLCIACKSESEKSRAVSARSARRF